MPFKGYVGRVAGWPHRHEVILAANPKKKNTLRPSAQLHTFCCTDIFQRPKRVSETSPDHLKNRGAAFRELGEPGLTWHEG